MQNKENRFLGAAAFTVMLSSALTTAGWAVYSKFRVNHRLLLPPAIDADRERLVSRQSRFLNYYVDRRGTGRPLVLIHSINAGASAYEMRPIFDHFKGKRPVYALDLPGFGFSERANRVYSPQLYRDAILDLLRMRIKEPVDIVALSLGAEFAGMAALESPECVHSLVMISPSGFTRREDKRASQQASDKGNGEFFHNLFSFPLWSQPFYDLLVSKPSIHFFLRQSFHGKVDEQLAHYDYLTTHQPGARYAPLYFVSGLLFTPDIRERVYEKLEQPVLVLHDRDSFVNFDTLPEVIARRPNWKAVRITPTMGLPHFEKPEATVQAMEQFWEMERV